LTHLTPVDLGLLRNRAVIAVDQDAIDARRIVDRPTAQIFTKTEAGGDAVVGLFNTGPRRERISTTAQALGLPAGPAYRVTDLWSAASRSSDGTIFAEVPSHGVALYRVVPG